jgi:signal transduction histidine kinase
MEAISAGLAHDIGHDLATVSCLIAALQRDTSLQADHRRRLELVEREVARVQTMVGQDSRNAPEDVAVRDVVTEVVEPLALTGDTEIVAHPLSDLRLTVDSRSLWRLVANLVGNAVRAAGPGGRVQVAVLGDPHPRIEITDDGSGFGTGPTGSAGVGLPTSRRLAVRCGARLDFTSPPGGGTVARVRFTGHAPAACAGHDAHGAIPAPRSPRG